MGLGGATLNDGSIGESLRADFGYPVAYSTGYINEEAKRYYRDRGFDGSYIDMVPALDRFDPNHRTTILCEFARCLDDDHVIFSQPMQTEPFAEAVLERSKINPQGTILRPYNPFPLAQLEVFSQLPEGTKCWVINPGHAEYLSAHNPNVEYGFLPMTLDTKRYTPEHPDTEEVLTYLLKSHLGIKPNDIMLFQPTRVHPQKQIDLSIDFALSLEAKTDKKVHLVIAGGNEQLKDSQDYEKAMKEYAESRGFPRLKMQGGLSGRKSIPARMKDYYRASDAVIAPSLIDSALIIIPEAAYMRRPIVTTRFGDEFLTDSFTPLYAPFDLTIIDKNQNLEPQAEQLSLLIDNPRNDSLDYNAHIAAEHFGIDLLPMRLEKLMA